MSLLEARKLIKKFNKFVAVDRVDLSVEQGTFHSVIGPNGAGKSTLFNLITGQLEPTDGTILFKGEDITDLPPYKIARRGISRSFQISDVFESLSVSENIRVAAQADSGSRNSMRGRVSALQGVNEKVEMALKDVALTDKSDERADELSHGDVRKLEIAMSAVNNPDLLLLDEPTAGMDKGTAVDTIKLTRRLSETRDITVVLIEHDIEIVMGVSDVITVLNQGRVIADGDPQSIQNDSNVQKAYLGGSQI